MASAVLLNCREKASASSPIKGGEPFDISASGEMAGSSGQDRSSDVAVVGQGCCRWCTELVEHRLVDGVDLSAVEPDDGDPCCGVAFELYY